MSMEFTTSLHWGLTDCPPGVPMFQCDGDPCSNAVCPSHPMAECRADFCGSCRAKWFVGEEQVTCNGMFSTCTK